MKDDVYTINRAIEEIYQPNGIALTNEPMREQEPKLQAYDAYRLGLAGKKVVYRAGKTTPTKAGQFVTVWKRPGSNIVPLTVGDVDVLVITAQHRDNLGQFIFDQQVLHKQGILSRSTGKSKLSFRVYPPWSSTTSETARATQEWQLNYFVLVDRSGRCDRAKIRKLFGSQGALHLRSP